MPANLTYSDIETRVMNALRLSTANTTEQAKVKNLINSVYRDIAVKSDWWWLLKRGTITTTPQITGLTASVSLNSAVGTFSTAPGQNGVAVSVGGFIMTAPGASFDSLALYHVTSTHAAGATAFTLDSPYTNVTSTSQGIALYQDAYILPADCQKVLQARRYGEILTLQRIGVEEMGRFKIFDTTVGKPEVYSVYDLNVTGDPTTQRLIQFHPYPEKYYRIEIFYKQMLNTELAGVTRPLIPDDFVQILEYGALARGYAIFLNDLERSKFYQSLFNDILALMVSQQKEYASDHTGVAPMERRKQIRLRRSGAVTLGSWFDRLPIDR